MLRLPPKKTGKFRRSLAMLDALEWASGGTSYDVEYAYRMYKRLHGVRR